MIIWKNMDWVAATGFGVWMLTLSTSQIVLASVALGALWMLAVILRFLFGSWSR